MGVWLARFDADGFRKEEKLGLADDILDAEGTRVLDLRRLRKGQDMVFERDDAGDR